MRRMLLILMIVIAVIAVALVGLRLGQVSIAKMVMSRIAAQNAGVDRATALPDSLRLHLWRWIAHADRSVPGPVRGLSPAIRFLLSIPARAASATCCAWAFQSAV